MNRKILYVTMAIVLIAGMVGCGASHHLRHHQRQDQSRPFLL